jgi:hypothetical protein
MNCENSHMSKNNTGIKYEAYLVAILADSVRRFEPSANVHKYSLFRSFSVLLRQDRYNYNIFTQGEER